MQEIYIITNYNKLNGVLDLYTDQHEAESDFNFYHDNGKRGETNLLKITYDNSKYDYDRYDYELNFFDKRKYFKRETINENEIKVELLKTKN